MKRIYFKIVSFLLVVLTLSSTAQGAVLYDYQEIRFQAPGNSDVVQNVLDPSEDTNVDTWDPPPEGVWFGGWAKETLMRIEDVPDTKYELALAQVCYFGSDVIMSGASRTLVRLPVLTTASTWSHGLLYVYEISTGTNWTFGREITERADTGDDHELNDMRINFTAGSYELIYWSQDLDPADTSKSDDDDHFSRSNRTYVYVDAPIKPATYYLFISYIWYASDQYVDVYLQPDSLDTTASWNRSTIATYNEEAPDLYDLGVFDFNFSMGYSFDFLHGFGNSAYGLNHWFYDGDDIEYYTYIDPDSIDSSHYLTFMMPFRSSVDNISWNVTLYAMNFEIGTTTVLFSLEEMIFNDFILYSMPDTWTTNITGDWTGWIKIYLTVGNNTRLWLPLWDIGLTNAMRWDDDFFINMTGSGFPELNFPHAPDGSFNLGQYLELERGSTPTYHYFWTPQHSIQFNDYYWTKTSGTSAGTDRLEETENMTHSESVFWAAGRILLKIGDVFTPIVVAAGEFARDPWYAAKIALYYGTGVLSQLDGSVWDTILQALIPIYALGRFLEKIGFSAYDTYKAALTFLDALLAVIIFILSMVAFFVPVYFTIKGAMALRKAVLGDPQGAIEEVKGAADTALEAGSKAAQAMPRRR